MATTYYLTIVNNSGSDLPKDYVIFSEPPKVSGTLGGVYSNAWVTFPNIAYPGGIANFQYKEDLYAYWGLPPQSVAPGVVVSSSQAVPVILGPDGTSVTFDAKIPRFVSPFETNSANGAFTIVAKSDFNSPSPFAFGLAKINNNGFPSPVASFQAEPSTTYNIFPVSKFYIASGRFTPGEVIDTQSIGTSQVVDFTGTPYNAAVVTQNTDGKYNVHYTKDLASSNKLIEGYVQKHRR